MTFPDDYRCFLLNFSDHDVVVTTPAVRLDGLYVERFYGFPTSYASDKSDVLQFDEVYIAPDAVSIGEDAFGGRFVMFLNESAIGRVYFYDTHGEGGDFQEDDSWLETGMSFEDLPKYDNKEDRPQAFVNFVFIAPTFTEFLRKFDVMPE